MRNFDYITNPAKLLTPEIVQMVGSIHKHKGKQELFLEALEAIAKRTSNFAAFKIFLRSEEDKDSPV